MPHPLPAKALDNLFFVGSRWNNAWTIQTSEGIILLDAMDNAEEAETIIADGLTRLGLDPKAIRYVIVSHGHSDHYGGAGYFKKLLGARIALGDTSVEIYLTLGYTLGTISPIFEVRDNGGRHRAILWVGSSFNFGKAHPEQLDAYLATARQTRARIRRTGIVVLISNHPEYDRSVVKFGKLARGNAKRNPFVIAVDGVVGATNAMEQCALATAEAWAASPAS